MILLKGKKLRIRRNFGLMGLKVSVLSFTTIKPHIAVIFGNQIESLLFQLNFIKFTMIYNDGTSLYRIISKKSKI
jgi:hypothetical protein